MCSELQVDPSTKRNVFHALRLKFRNDFLCLPCPSLFPSFHNHNDIRWLVRCAVSVQSVIVFGFAVAVCNRCGRVQQGGFGHPSPERIHRRQRSDHAADVSGGVAVQWSEGRRSERDAQHQHHASPRVEQRHGACLQASQNLPQRLVADIAFHKECPNPGRLNSVLCRLMFCGP